MRTLYGFLQQVHEDWVAHGRDWTRAGFQALLVHRFGAARRRIRSRLLRAPFSLVYKGASVVVRNVYGIELPDTVEVGRRLVIEHQHGIVIHGNVIIGDDCVIRHGVTLGIRTLDRLADAPVLGNRVELGAGAKVLGAVKIGDRACIGANAVVLVDVPPDSLAAGVPATVRPHRAVDRPPTVTGPSAYIRRTRKTPSQPDL